MFWYKERMANTPSVLDSWQRTAIRFVRTRVFEDWVDNPHVVEAFRNYFSTRNPGFIANHWVFTDKQVTLSLGPTGLVTSPRDIPALHSAYDRIVHEQERNAEVRVLHGDTAASR